MIICRRDICTGCSACMAICPKNAISMEVNGKDGFLYPRINCKLCVNCRLCRKVCPIHKSIAPGPVKECYAARTKNVSERTQASSGGIFLELARKTIAQGGVIYGCVAVSRSAPLHVRAETEADVLQMRGSKYVQSYIGLTFRDVKRDLECGRHVLFSGTPCQIMGLKSYLGGNRENLLLVQIICHGVPSAISYMNLVGNLARWHRGHGSIVSLSFRDKNVKMGLCSWNQVHAAHILMLFLLGCLFAKVAGCVQREAAGAVQT